MNEEEPIDKYYRRLLIAEIGQRRIADIPLTIPAPGVHHVHVSAGGHWTWTYPTPEGTAPPLYSESIIGDSYKDDDIIFK